MMVNSVCELGWAPLSWYLVKHDSECFSEGVLGETLSEADCPPVWWASPKQMRRSAGLRGLTPSAPPWVDPLLAVASCHELQWVRGVFHPQAKWGTGHSLGTTPGSETI